MNENNAPTHHAPQPENWPDEPVLLDYLLPIAKWRWIIITGVALAGVIGLIIALNQKPYYTSTLYLIPHGAFGETGELESLVGRTGRELGRSQNSSMIQDYYAHAFGSRPVLRRLLERSFSTSGNKEPQTLLKLLSVPAGSPAFQLEKGLDRVKRDMTVRVSGGKIVAVSYTSHDPQLSADVANAIPEIYTELSRQDDSSSSVLSLIQDRLRSTQKKLTAKENEITEIKSRLLDSMQPDGQMRLNVLMREANDLERFIETLNSELALAEIRQMQKQQELMQEFDIIEPAAPPLMKSGPSKKRTLLLFLALGATLTTGIIFVVEYFQNARRLNQDHPFWQYSKQSLRDFIIVGAVAILCGAALLLYLRISG
ncbi:hypothetical protein JXA32_06680 [Candidatus Sumerlaeota bacterium]|nr:hypothetical protein [Candidatus Sumerlaeota bacterium]